jgi:ParB family chromosome partitioning protein
MAKTKLGRGLDVLIPKELDPELLETDASRAQRILISDIKPNPAQPRGQMNQAALDELSQSIKRHGVLQPIIVVRDKGHSGYIIVAGERRWRAARAAKLKSIPAIIRSMEELEQVEVALIENIQRVDLSPLEQAVSVFKLQQQFNMSLDQIAQKLGKAPSTLSNLTRLLGLTEAARESLRQGKISEGHARAILALKANPSKQIELLDCILNNGWNVRRAEQYVLEVKKTGKRLKPGPKELQSRDVARELSLHLGVAVKIRSKGSAGRIIIPFADQKELEKLTQKIQKK